jgi:NhaP-type Na+/H+ or K+/H+ antiporter/CRP-like cAMP-binding protein
MRKKLLILSLLLSLSFLFYHTSTTGSTFSLVSPKDKIEQPQQESSLKEQTQGHPVNGEEQEASSHQNNMFPLLFIIIAILIGAATRHFFRKSPLPYTVTLLLIGLLLGALFRVNALETWDFGFAQLDVSFLHNSIKWAGNIDPHLILYVFLPTLIFEAAFAMDLHTFRKSFGNAFMMAVPGIIVALFFTAALTIGIKSAGIGLSDWNWKIALLFGVVISATDPVAVVSLLKGLGASKKLATLIEGESLLNDGTAIVIFMVVLGLITGNGGETSPFLEFLRVALGGAFVGLVIGGITISWVKKVFNDALVEITVIIGAAYLTFFICEHFFHVSGILGLVALGLLMTGIGRTRISPEVEHFLHEFWEMAAFLANTLIFLMVGVVIASNIVFTANDFLILGMIYIGLHVIRGLVITAFFPLMKNLGYGLDRKNAYILWWGALRGAIGLALALIVAGESVIPEQIRQQFLFHTAGIVTLTSFINATTIKIFVKKLGLDKLAPAKALMLYNAKKHIREATENSINKLKKDRFVKKADWEAVKEYLPETPSQEEIEDQKMESRLAETRRRVLEKEKASYWSQFKDGMLGSTAVRRLSDAINEIIDQGGTIPLSEREDLEQLWRTPKILNKLQQIPFLGRIAERIFIDNLAVSYDTAKGFITAQYDSLKLVESMYIKTTEDNTIEEDLLQQVENEINENRIHGITFLRNLRNSYPEIYNAISTRQAIRSTLNYEQKALERLLKKGQVDSEEAKRINATIEQRMKQLINSPPSVKTPEKANLLVNIPWFKDLDKETFNKIANLFQYRVFAVGEKIIKEQGQTDGLYIIARGNVKVYKNQQLIEVLGKGNIIGEIATLADTPRTATVVAESPVSALRLTTVSMQQTIQGNKTLEDKLWEIAAPRMAENILNKTNKYNELSHKELKKWIDKGEVIHARKITNYECSNQLAIVLTGRVILGDNTELHQEQMVRNDTLTLGRKTKVYILPQKL